MRPCPALHEPVPLGEQTVLVYTRRLVGEGDGWQCASGPHECLLQGCSKSVPQECLTRVSHRSVVQECPAQVSLARASYKSIPFEHGAMLKGFAFGLGSAGKRALLCSNACLPPWPMEGCKFLKASVGKREKGKSGVVQVRKGQWPSIKQQEQDQTMSVPGPFVPCLWFPARSSRVPKKLVPLFMWCPSPLASWPFDGDHQKRVFKDTYMPTGEQ